jgi:acetyl esterase/lipase
MTHRPVLVSLTLLLMLGGCAPRLTQKTGALADARKGFVTKPDGKKSGESVPTPPGNDLKIVSYQSPAGEMAAYLAPPPNDGKKHPAIVWITGGDCNTIGDVWSAPDPENDQTAAVYRSIGIATMYPSLRGGNTNPGVREGFYGEVDDVIAAAEALKGVPGVDPQRIYLGGHSTGGTLALLVAEMTDQFRAVFSFGPVGDVSVYPKDFTPFNTASDKEVELRSPGFWLNSVRSPTFVIEGTGDGNIGSLRSMKSANKNPQVHFVAVEGADHFSVLGPMNGVIAGKITKDTGPSTNITLTAEEASQAVKG